MDHEFKRRNQFEERQIYFDLCHAKYHHHRIIEGEEIVLPEGG
jgi:hypothetical protein